MKRDLFLLRSIAVCILMLLMPLLSIAADTIRVNIPRVTVTMARSYNFSSAANSVYVPVEFNSAMSADKVADYIEESNAFLFDHYGEDVVEISGVSDDFGTIYLDIKPNTGIKRVLLITSTGSGSVVERNDYYPMGMRTATGNSYPQLTTNLYKYNGKEVQTVGGLGFTDYGARMYDDFTGRWFVPDPLAEKYASMSPYMYCGGNPISMVDVDGRDWYQGKVKDGRMGIEWKNSQDLTIEDDAGITWTNIGENYIKENLGIITLYTQGKDKDGNLYKQSSEYYLDDESSMADLNSKVADLSSKGSAIAGSIGLLAENCSATFRLTNSKGLWKPKFYKNGWRGNQWVTPYSVSKLGKGVDYFGKTLGIIGMSASGFQFMQASTLEGKVEHGLDFFYGSYRFCA